MSDAEKDAGNINVQDFVHKHYVARNFHNQELAKKDKEIKRLNLLLFSLDEC